MENMSIIKRDVASLEVANVANRVEPNHLASTTQENANFKDNDVEKQALFSASIEVRR